MTQRRQYLWMSVPVLAMAVLMVWLFSHSRVDHETLSYVRSHLLSLNQIDARINEHVVKARAGLSHDFDGIVSAVSAFERELRSFRATLARTGTSAAAFDLSGVERVETAFERKRDSIERFKFHAAIYRLTENVFPVTARDLIFSASMSGDIDPDKRDYLVRLSERLVSEVLSSLVRLSDHQAVIERIRSDLLRFSGSLDQELRDRVQLMVRYSTRLVGEHAHVNSLVGEVLGSSTKDRIAELISAHQGAWDTLNREAASYRSLLFVVTGLLLGYLALVLRRLKRIGDELDGAMRELGFQKYALDQHAIVVAVDADGRITYVNDRFCDLSQYPREELIGRELPFVSAGGGDGAGFGDMWRFVADSRTWRGEICESRRDGSVYWLNSTVVPFLNEHDEVFQYIVISTDITAMKEAEREIEVLARFPEENPGVVMRVDTEGRILYANPVAESLLSGWDIHAGDLLPEGWRPHVRQCLEDGVGEFDLEHDGHHVLFVLAPVPDAGYVNFYGTDVTARKRAEARLAHQARHDALTGLVNRREFEHEMEKALSETRESGVEHALLYLDLDQFKIVNDTCGHMAGDELLKQLSTLILGTVRDTDVLARIGGDEFGLLLHGCPLDRARHIAGTLLDLVNQYRFEWDGKGFEVGVSIGVAPINRDSLSLASVLSAADVACYAAKDAGRNRVHVYGAGDSIAEQRQGEMQWVSRITTALEQERFRLYGQVIQPIGSDGDAPVHVELLIRMLDDDGGIVPPGHFIPAAERYHLMPAMDRWVVEAVTGLYAEWRAIWRRGVIGMLGVNLSGASMGDDRLLGYIQGQLKANPDLARNLCFEVTETAAIANMSTAICFIRELKDMGCRFALDDFGSGLSSFGYLKNLPVDYLKIDGSFVRDMLDDTTDAAMVAAIHQVGHTMGIRTIAEFVESDGILAALAEMGVDYAQGYAIHAPEPIEALLGRLGNPEGSGGRIVAFGGR